MSVADWTQLNARLIAAEARLIKSRNWSGRRESNPRMQLGKLPFCH